MASRVPAWIQPLRSALTDSRIAILVIVAFALFNLVGLDRVPLVNGDEPWIAEPGYQFWQQGRFVSELDRGLFGTERHYLLHFPLFSIIVGGVISVFGRGLWQVRLVSLSMAVATAALTFALGRRLLSARHGLFAVLALTLWRITPGLPFQPSGIVLVDLGRLARYDIAVPVFGVTAFLLIVPLLGLGSPTPLPRDSGPPLPPLQSLRLALAGACAGLGVLCHPAGVAWVGVLCATLWVARGWVAAVKGSAWIVLGTVIVLLPYLWYLHAGWADFVEQQKYVGERYDVLNPWFYARNVAREWRRYSQIGRGVEHLQPGAWLIVLSGLIGLWALWRGPSRDDLRVRVLGVALLVGAGLFALGLQPKYYFYVATLWPLIALAVAVGLAMLLGSTVRPIRLAAGMLLILAIVDGLADWARIAQRAASATPYSVLCDRLAAQLPPGTRLLALPQYWLGLASRVDDYRSLQVPVLLASPKFKSADMTLADALTATGANVILLDPPMLDFLGQALDPHNPAHEFGITAKGLREYLADRSERHVSLDESPYGHFEIHYLRPWTARTTTPP